MPDFGTGYFTAPTWFWALLCVALLTASLALWRRG